MRLAPSILAFAAALALSAPALAATYTATLSGAAEAPPNASPGTGLATVIITGKMMQVQVSFSDLVAGVTASHIHCCTALAGVGTASVATQTPTFTGFPSGVTSGTYDHTFDMSLASSYRAGFITDHGGSADTAFVALVAGLDAGMAYLNIHTTTYPGGEIRGFLAPIPEPETYALMLAGLGMVGWAARRRQRA